ncbi:MAG: alanine racemase [Gemmatimonadota bacterium]
MAIPRTRAWIEVDLEALRANYDTIRRAVGPGAALLPMVKADAYGVGAACAVRVFEPLEPWGYGVATAVEGAALRADGVRRPILVAGPLPGGDVDIAARARLTASISSVGGLEAWIGAAERAGATLDFHVDVDTGMGRSGFDWRDSGAWIGAVREAAARAGSSSGVRWTGVFTHFHSADAADEAGVLAQWERFRDTLVQLPMPRESLLVHAANSAAAFRWPAMALDLVRPGIFLYGGHPAPGVSGVPRPAPVVAVRARLVHVRSAVPGSTVGYGATYTAVGPERWGTMSIGYGDGLPRILGNRGTALVRGRRVPMIGRISMDLTTVRLDGVPGAVRGDVATLIGEDGAERITVDEVAEDAGTIGYEILVAVGRSRLPRLERTYETEGERA